jgi:hypothetical protein
MFTNLILNSPRKCAATIVLCLIAGGAFAAPEPAPIRELRQASVEELKLAYLNCNREALAGRLDRGAIMSCSMVYEALKEKAFGGDFARLLTWSRAQEIASDSLPRTAESRL